MGPQPRISSLAFLLPHQTTSQLFSLSPRKLSLPHLLSLPGLLLLSLPPPRSGPPFAAPHRLLSIRLRAPLGVGSWAPSDYSGWSAQATNCSPAGKTQVSEGPLSSACFQIVHRCAGTAPAAKARPLGEGRPSAGRLPMAKPKTRGPSDLLTWTPALPSFTSQVIIMQIILSHRNANCFLRHAIDCCSVDTD